MIEGKTKSGFKFKIDERVLDDWRLLSYIAMSESDNASEQIQGAYKLVSLLLGDDEKKFMDFIASKNDGFIPSSVVSDTLAEIIKSAKDLKNL